MIDSAQTIEVRVTVIRYATDTVHILNPESVVSARSSSSSRHPPSGERDREKSLDKLMQSLNDEKVSRPVVNSDQREKARRTTSAGANRPQLRREKTICHFAVTWQQLANEVEIALSVFDCTAGQ